MTNYLIYSSSAFPTVDTFCGLPKKGYINGVEQAEYSSINFIKCEKVANYNILIRRKYVIKESCITDIIDKLLVDIDNLSVEQQEFNNTLVTMLEDVIESAEQCLTEEEALSSGYIINVNDF